MYGVWNVRKESFLRVNKSEEIMFSRFYVVFNNYRRSMCVVVNAETFPLRISHFVISNFSAFLPRTVLAISSMVMLIFETEIILSTVTFKQSRPTMNQDIAHDRKYSYD